MLTLTRLARPIRLSEVALVIDVRQHHAVFLALLECALELVVATPHAEAARRVDADSA